MPFKKHLQINPLIHLITGGSVGQEWEAVLQVAVGEHDGVDAHCVHSHCRTCLPKVWSRLQATPGWDSTVVQKISSWLSQGLFITIHDKGHVLDVLKNWPEQVTILHNIGQMSKSTKTQMSVFSGCARHRCYRRGEDPWSGRPWGSRNGDPGGLIIVHSHTISTLSWNSSESNIWGKFPSSANWLCHTHDGSPI